jgi:glucose 1-dehydrogenase
MQGEAREFEDDVAVVTGADSGIGAETAVALGARGCAVVVDYIDDEASVGEVCGRITRAGGRALAVKADVRNEDGVANLFAQTLAAFGTPTILVNNAGVNMRGVHVADMTLGQWEDTLRVNLTGPFLCSRAFVRERRGKNGEGRIVNISSVHEELVFAGAADYDASKYGLLGFARTLALEAAALHIRVNNVAPGMILTAMNAEAASDPGVLEEKSEHIPLRRAGKAEEVAGAVVFLCSKAGAYVTGTSIRIDGGLSLNAGQGA